jgi:hypothetical protein
MNSLVYFYSKFTEEFLLLSAAGVFTLLSIYCYHWVIQKRRLGVARSQIPSTVVKSYLNQLINEAEFVRKQLFGMTDSHTSFVPTQGFGSATTPTFTAPAAEGNQTISPDLMARVNSLESQLKEKESLVVNINIEKTKLLAEIDKMKANPAAAPAASAGNQDQLSQKIKNLEARLEEYALFEEDLANLKRLQQENTQLKKKLSESGSSPSTSINIPAAEEAPFEKRTLSAVPDIAPAAEAAAPAEEPKHALDQDAIDALLNGTPATPPESQPVEAAAAPSLDDLFPEGPKEPSSPTDQFERLVDSVENSLEKAAPAPEPAPIAAAPTPAPAPAPTPAPAAVAAAAPKAAAAPESPLANKTDEELLKEFENLLNS